jgi:secreted trypsin-like serine protease
MRVLSFISYPNRLDSEFYFHKLLSYSSASSYTILLGAHNRNSPQSHEQRIRAKKIIVHPQYGRPALNNDIALIQLERAATLTNRVSTVCLPNHNFEVPLNSECYITGKLWW